MTAEPQTYPLASAYRDRHGKTRWRFRRGPLTVSLRGAPGDTEFAAAYDAALRGNPIRHSVRRAKLAPIGLVYVIQGDPAGPVKIGFSLSDALPKRLAVLQTGNPFPLRLLGQIEAYPRHERIAHVALATERVFGEWFAWSERTRRFVAAFPAGIEVALNTARHSPSGGHCILERTPTVARLGRTGRCSFRTTGRPPLYDAFLEQGVYPNKSPP